MTLKDTFNQALEPNKDMLNKLMLRTLWALFEDWIDKTQALAELNDPHTLALTSSVCSVLRLAEDVRD